MSRAGWLRVARIGGIALVSIVALPAIWIALHREDGPAPDLSALTGPPPPPLAPEENALTELDRAAAALFWDEADPRLAECTTADPDDIRGLLDRNRAALAHFQRASHFPDFRTPAMVTVADDPPNTIPWIQLTALAAPAALDLARRGEAERAVDLALAPVRLGHLVERDRNATLIHAMVGLGLKQEGYEAVARVLGELAPDRDLARRSIAVLEAARTRRDAWLAMLRFEQRVMVQSTLAEPRIQFNAISEEEAAAAAPWWVRWLPRDYVYHPHETLAIYGEIMDDYRRVAGRECQALPPTQEPEDLGIAGHLRLLGPNGAGRELMSGGFSHLLRFEIRRCRSESWLSATQLRLALRAWEGEGHPRPDDLAVLVPAFFTALPQDAWDGGALRYDAARGELYSLGAGIDPTKWTYFEGLTNSLEWPRWPIIEATSRQAPDAQTNPE